MTLEAEKIARAVAAAKRVSAELSRRGVPHALVGGLAVGEYGWSRFTADVDILVPSDREDVLKARRNVCGLSFRGAPLAGTSAEKWGVSIDFIRPTRRGAFLDAAIDAAELREGVPVLPLPALVTMKLWGTRRKDELDVIELLKANRRSVQRIHRYLQAHAPESLAAFETLEAIAAVEVE